MSLTYASETEELNRWLFMLINADGTDLHIKSNSNVRARIQEEIQLLSKEIISSNAIEVLVKSLTAEKYEAFKEIKEFDGTYRLNHEYRFRFNIAMHLNGFSLTFRLIPPHIKTIEELHLPKALHKLVHLQRGLVLITGTTGSGKSTTLASIIEEINQTYHYHIIIIEDPIEYEYHDTKSLVEQREVGTHTNSFSAALRAAMREDPDIIVVGEIRDIDTAENILQAVNTGHLIFSTIHTADARETIDRLIAIFPTNEQNRVRETLAATLEAVISQRLLKGVYHKMIPAVEMMFKSPLIKELIRTKRDNEILDAIEKEGISFDSICFNQALFDLTLAGEITEEEAYLHATSSNDLKLMFTTSSEYVKQHTNDLEENGPLFKEDVILEIKKR